MSTFEAFLERCDPDLARLDLAPLSDSDRGQLEWRVLGERGLTGRPEHRLSRLSRAPVAGAFALHFAPAVMRVRRALERHQDLRGLMRTLDAASRSPRMFRRARPELIVAGVRWATRLLGCGAFGVCLVRALAVFTELAARGWPVVFVCGVRRAANEIESHAWVECDGERLLGGDDAGAPYRVTFRYPGLSRRAVAHRDRARAAVPARARPDPAPAPRMHPG